ncbi:MAG: DUF2194 domain-containing protein [Candidatus Asgardarchaeum sp.]
MRKVTIIILLFFTALLIQSTLIATISAQEEEIKILWDNSHGQYYSLEKYTKLESDLESQGIMVDPNDANVTYDILKDYDIFVIPNPISPFSEDELNALSEYVSNGGKLLIMGDVQYGDRHYGQPDNLNTILQTIGVADKVEFYGTNDNGDEIYDDTSNDGSPWNVLVTKDYFQPHIISAGIETVYINSPSLIVYDSSIIVATSDEDSYAKDTNDNIHKVGYIPWLVAIELENTRIIVCGSSKMFSDKQGTSEAFVSLGDNEKLFFNIVGWLKGGFIKAPTKLELFIPILDIFGLAAGVIGMYVFRGNTSRAMKYALIVAIFYVIVALIQYPLLGTIVVGIGVPGWGRAEAGLASENLEFDIPPAGVAAIRYFLASLFEFGIGAFIFMVLIRIDYAFDLGIAEKIGYSEKKETTAEE